MIDQITVFLENKKDAAASAHAMTARDLFARVKTVDEKIVDIKSLPSPRD